MNVTRLPATGVASLAATVIPSFADAGAASTSTASPTRASAFTTPLRRTGVGGSRRSGAAVPVLEPHDVVELRRRHLQDRRVLDRGHAVHRAGLEAERLARLDDVLGEL